MKSPVFSGVCTALVTPFLDNKVNYPLMQQLIRRQWEAGVEAVVLSGTTGESPTLSDTEKIEMFHRAKEFTKDNCKIIAGTGTNSTEHAVELSQAAQEAGADAILVVSPYYNKGNTEGLFRHYFQIAKSVHIPIILYNVPSRTGIDIPISIYQALTVMPNIIGVKEAGRDVTKVTQIRKTCGKDFYVWSGNDDLSVPVISLGGKGVISVISNIFPEETVTMVNAALDGDFDTASAYQCRLQPYMDALFAEVNPIPVKYAMKYAGFDCGGCRLPLGELSDNAKQSIDKLFS